MKQRVPSRSSSSRRPLQSRSAENLTSSNQLSSHEAVGVGRCRSAHELVNTDSQRDRELYSPSHGSCVVDNGHHHPHARRLGPGARHRSRSREPPAADRALSHEERERVVENMHREFSGKRKAVLNGLSMGCTEEVGLFRAVCVCVCTGKYTGRGRFP